MTPAPSPSRPFAARLRDVLRARPLLTAVLATAAPALVAVAAFTPRYQTNDDVVMNLIAAGLGVSDRPDEHLLFSNVALGLPLKWLYGAFPAVPWYGGFQFAAVCAAAAAVAYALVRVDPSPGQAAVVLLFLGAAVLPCLTELQFTKTAFLMSFAGLALFLAPLRGAVPWPRAADAAAGALLVLGSLVRFQSFLLAAAVAAPVAVAGALADPKGAVRRAVPLAVAAAASVALYFFNLNYYARDDAWKDFYAYNALRAEFIDYQRYPFTDQTRPAFEAVGWGPIDLEMLNAWFFADPDRYGLTRLRQLAATVPPRPPLPPGEIVAQLAQSLPKHPHIVGLMLAPACAAVLTGRGWRRFILPAVLSGVALGLVAALGSFYWLPVRVTFPLFAGVLAGAALRPPGSPHSDAAFPAAAEPGPRPGPAARERGRGSRTRDPSAALASASVRRYAPAAARLVAGVAAAGLAINAVRWVAAEDGRRLRLHQVMDWSIRQLDVRPDRLYVVWGECFRFEEVVSPLAYPDRLRNLRCVWLSALLPTPFTRERLREFDIGDLSRAIWERRDVDLVATPALLRLFQRYALARYQTDVRFRTIFIQEDVPPPLLVVRGEPAGVAEP